MAWNVFKLAKLHNKPLIILTAPLITAILPILVNTKEANCAFVVILMAIYWVTEALPLGITSLLPVVLFPTLGISPAEKVTSGYFKDIVMLFFGGLVVANSIEICKLHERIALKVLMMFGSNPKWLLLGFMLVTAFLSLWISNTASTAMMLPIIDAVVSELIKNDCNFQTNQVDGQHRASIPLELYTSSDKISTKSDKCINENEKARKMRIGFLLSAAYSSSIGGLGSLVGTAPNVLVKGYFDKNYPELRLNFFSFMLFALPVSFIMLIFAWIWLIIKWLPLNLTWKKRVNDERSRERAVSLKPVLQQKYNELGETTWSQYCVGSIFVILVTLWVTKDLHFIGGWGSLFKKDYVTDSIPAILAVFLLFIIPRENIFRGKKYEHLVDWRSLQKTFPWDIVFLLGGSLVMADGFKESGLSIWIGSQFNSFANQRKEILLIILILIVASLTEFTSNTSIASIFLPIIDQIAKQSNINPVYLLLPMILSVSLAFALPIATPPNAVIFSYGHLKMRDMITTGIPMNFLGMACILLAANTWLMQVFNLNLNESSQFQTNSTLKNI